MLFLKLSLGYGADSFVIVGVDDIAGTMKKIIKKIFLKKLAKIQKDKSPIASSLFLGTYHGHGPSFDAALADVDKSKVYPSPSVQFWLLNYL